MASIIKSPLRPFLSPSPVVATMTQPLQVVHHSCRVCLAGRDGYHLPIQKPMVFPAPHGARAAWYMAAMLRLQMPESHLGIGQIFLTPLQDFMASLAGATIFFKVDLIRGSLWHPKTSSKLPLQPWPACMNSSACPTSCGILAKHFNA